MKILNKNLIFNVFIVFCFLSPTKEWAYLLGYILLFLNLKRLDLILTYENIFKSILGLLIGLAMVLNARSMIDPKDLMIIFNFGLLFLLFPYFIGKGITIKPFSILFITLSIIFSQIIFFFDIEFLKVIIYKIYENETGLRNFDSFIVGAGRNGGLFYNPNQASKYLNILLAVALVSVKNYNFQLLLSGLITFSVFLTGSRTGLIVVLLILLYYLIIIKKDYLISLLLTFCGAGAIMIKNLYENTRSLSLSETGSLDYKVDSLLDYFNKVAAYEPVKSLLFGNLVSDYDKLASIYDLDQKYKFGFDAEVGFMISFFGLIITLLILVFFLKQSLKLIQTKYYIIIIPFFVWPITSTILFSFKTSLVYMVLLAYSINKSTLVLEE